MRFERLEPRLALAGVVINEFLASNVHGIVDQDGDHSDWIELKNTNSSPVDLGGWRLTDEAGKLDKWEFPAITLNPGAYLKIFASDKDRRVAGQELHTNFKLATEGEYLALVMPDGVTIADAFNPYPAQRDDISFGVGTNPGSIAPETLVGAASPVRVISPTAENAAVDDQWREIRFDDSSWLSGMRSIGFDRDGTNDFGPFIGRTLTTGEMPSSGSPRYTAYVRYNFNVADKAQLTSLDLNLRFDDGFIAYLNGHEVARANFGEDFVYPQPEWDSRSRYQLGTSSAGAFNRGAESLTPVAFDLTPYLSSLVNGPNVLAFHVVNSASTSGTGSGQDLLLEPVMTAERSSGVQVGSMADPTPGGANGTSRLGIVGDTHFSIDRGFFDAPFQLAISTSTSTASMRYTTDGSLPSATEGTLYTGPITISATTILRAVAYQAGYTPSNVDTETYIFLSDVIHQSASDVTQAYATWGHDKEDADSTSGYNLDDEADWEMDPEVVNANVATIIDDLKAIPTVSLVMDWDDLFGGNPLPGTPTGSGAVAPAPQGIYVHGSSSERGASFEFFNPHDATDQTHIDAAVEIQGHSSALRWNSDKLSFQVKFKEPYGPSKLDYPQFAGSPDGASATSEFDTLILDATYNYSWTHNNPQQRDFARFVTDQALSDLQNLASGGGQAPHGKFVHLYLNGLYWGMYDMHERPDASFAAEYYGGDKDDYHIIKATDQDFYHEYSWVDGGVAAELDYQSLLAAVQAVKTNPTSTAAYSALEQMLDVDQFIDYMIVHYYGGGGVDWAHNNWYASRDANGGKWRFHAWDQEHTFPTTDNGDSWNQNTNWTSLRDLDAPTRIHRDLMGDNTTTEAPNSDPTKGNLEYRLRFADRVQELMYNGGVLTPAAARATYEARTNEIDRAIVGESARWGDNRNVNDPYTRADFLAIKNGVLNDFFPVRTTNVLGQFAGAKWLPALAAPAFSKYGGDITPGFELTLSKPAGSPVGGTIYYTTDGSDPRLVGGAVSPTAVAYAAPISVADATRVKARIFFDAAGNIDDWSPLVDKTFLVPEPFPLRIVELNYNPAPFAGIANEQDLEFIELQNVGESPVSLNGVQIAGFASSPYVFASGLTLNAGQRIVVAKNPTAFQRAYGMAINLAPGGYGTSNLSNSGEAVVLLGPVGETLQTINYSDEPPWPKSADGGGRSLEIINPLGDANSPANWRASLMTGGSPGTDGQSPAAIPGDFNGDHGVDGSDFLAWQRGLGTPAPNATTASGDADGDHDVDGSDLALWQANFGETAAATRAPVGALSEPTLVFANDEWILSDSTPVAAQSVTKRAQHVDTIFATWRALPDDPRTAVWQITESPIRRRAMQPARTNGDQELVARSTEHNLPKSLRAASCD